MEIKVVSSYYSSSKAIGALKSGPYDEYVSVHKAVKKRGRRERLRSFYQSLLGAGHFYLTSLHLYKGEGFFCANCLSTRHPRDFLKSQIHMGGYGSALQSSEWLFRERELTARIV